MTPTPGAGAAARHEFQTLNALRGVAALTILLWHFAPLNARGLGDHWSAYLAVDLFFLLSGTVIAHVYEAKLRAGWSVARFLIARIIRLWPLYLLGTAIGAFAVVAAAYAGGAEPWQFKPLIADGVRALFLWPKLADGVLFPYNPPGWSLFCEFVVNVAYGVVGYRLSDRALAVTAAVGLAAAVAGGIAYIDLGNGLNLGALGAQWWIGLARAVFGFALGVLLYRRWASGRLPKIRISPLLIVAGFLLALLVAPESFGWRLVAALLVAAIVWPLLVTAAIQVEPSGWQRRCARQLAELSFAIYALHDALYIAADAVSNRSGISAGVTFTIAAVISLLLAPAANRLFDQPVRRWLTRLAAMPLTAARAAPL